MFYLQKKELMFVKRNCPAAINKINVVLAENFPPQIFGQILYYKNSPNFLIGKFYVLQVSTPLVSK